MSSSSATRVVDRRLVEAVGQQRFCEHVEHRQPRVQRGDRILEHHLQVAAQRSAAARGRGSATSVPSTSIVPACGAVSSRIWCSVVDLPEPDSPTMPSVRPCCSSKLTPSTARTSPIRAAQHHALGQRVGLDQVVDPQHHAGRRAVAVGAARLRWTRRRSRLRCGRRRARCGCTPPWWPAPTVTSSGSAVRHSSIASGQRGANGQPGGSAASDGGAPGIGTSRAPCGASRRGTEPSSPAV